MKRLYEIPLERSSNRVMEIRWRYVQSIMDLEACAAPCVFVYVDEAGFNLSRVRRHGRNTIGKRATVNVPDQRGGNKCSLDIIAQPF
ncbi:hypothetical protein SKAU_G00298100 [Synaphobranchus kaupii]|uniref:Uncharacterized protein n=1 Tax=Synaphobranchus kaupii TaxID=118154 RepID=A0A9Q1EV84_SYNKA|nr:hypothetical protein SKAU_G00298100 [Synaphobranchus kaupii]